VNGAPRQLTLGAGRFIYPTIGRDGQVAFAVMDSARVVERVSLGRDTESPSTLYSDNGNAGGRPSETADGSTIVFEQSFGPAREVWLRSTRSGQQQMVLRVDSSLPVDAVISPDGGRIGYTVGQTPDRGTGYVADAAGGVPMKICDDCGVHGFLSDNRRILVVNNGLHTIRVVNVMTGIGEDAMTVTENKIDRPHASPDDHWLAFRIVKGAMAKSYVTSLKPGSPAPSSAWHQVEEPTTTGRPAGWSPDSSVLYLLLDTDGFRCLWGQQVDPVAGSLNGAVFVARHLHYLGTVGGPSTSYGNPVTGDGFLYGVIRPRSNIWRGFLAKPNS
jgi:Tol biopolymer transport system component